ncbi:MAG: GntR family transcriptional regulator [Oceanicola sp.]|nr:GntR family transcriptional regulator [Oceanicola sp.]
MARSNRLYKRCYNDALDLIAANRMAGSVSELATRLDVSRNTARRVAESLQENGILQLGAKAWNIERPPEAFDYFPSNMVETTEKMIERAFMEMVLNERLRPNSRINEAALAKEIGVSNSAVREFLIRLSRFEFVRKEPQKSWTLVGFTESYAEELHEVRVMFELRSIEKLIGLPEEHLFWVVLQKSHREHLAFLESYDENFMQFPALDAEFHRQLNSASHNRFIESFQEAISLIFHYHYRWNKSDEKERNYAAAKEHVDVIEALLLRDEDAATQALEAHLLSAKRTLRMSIK